MTAAVASAPPRPRVVVTPWRVAPMKPPSTGTRPVPSMGSSWSRTRGAISWSSGEALPKASSVMTRVRASTTSARRPSCTRASATISQESRSPMAPTASRVRGVSSSSA